MAGFTDRLLRNVPGKYYVDGQCTDCDLCRELAPQNFRRDDALAYSYVFKQPTSAEEVAKCEEAVRGCPTDGVRNDGDQFDWETELIFDWNAWLKQGPTLAANAPLVTPKKLRQESGEGP